MAFWKNADSKVPKESRGYILEAHLSMLYAPRRDKVHAHTTIILWWDSCHGEIWNTNDKRSYRLFYYSQSYIGIKCKPESKRWQKSTNKTSESAQEIFEKIRGAIDAGYRPGDTQGEEHGHHQLSLELSRTDKQVNSDCWYTPPQIVELVREVLTTIDLDPCADERKHIPAKYHKTIREDGLACAWHGKVFINPPYSCPGKWIKKLVEEIDSGNVTEAIALLPVATDTKWFEPLWNQSICFWKGRIKFLDVNYQPKAPARQSHCLVYWGENVEGFYQVFGKYGEITCPPLERSPLSDIEEIYVDSELIIGLWEDANLKEQDKNKRKDLLLNATDTVGHYPERLQILWWDSCHGEAWIPIESKSTHRFFCVTENYIGIKTVLSGKTWQRSNQKSSKLAQKIFDALSSPLKKYRPGKTKAEIDKRNQKISDMCKSEREAEAKRRRDKQVRDEIHSSLMDFCSLRTTEIRYSFPTFEIFPQEISDDEFRLITCGFPSMPNFYITHLRDDSDSKYTQFKVEFDEKKYWEKSLLPILKCITGELEIRLRKVA
ncbi:MAG: hypothetical protein F6K40_12485 [Okeania sp. SIO3I5]|uniref:DNA N-6-adenine-methyltransferase n=1 Tax=Okeania sp. SIO3I5 TaxID=2607805 RepID=UPI0013BB79CE|nr:DNA N-6-adenine-methyltransferase [Okeania sp. SIO3I5]NEQ37047.1 hypothetical protein [Okeania sp. SIO3I5]